VTVAADGAAMPGQLTAPGLMSRETLDEDEIASMKELHFLVPKLAAGTKATYTVTVTPGGPDAAKGYRWTKAEGKSAELSHGGRPVLKYMCEPVDDSSAARREETFKVYHHLYDPTGTKLLTKGPGGTFPHHRGIFYGFNRISYGDKTADVWHCRNGESQLHQDYLAEEAGPVLGRHRVKVAWNGKDGKAFASEERELTAYATPTGQLIGFASRLTTTLPEVKLDGDPQHAGFQFRATQAVPDKTAAQTYYLRPDGKGEPKSFRNWPGDAGHVNLPWTALSFVLDGQRYTVLYEDRPANPKEARFSERDYGRFGSYFEYALTPEKPLVIAYRLFALPGEMTVADAAREAAELTDPPAAQVLPAPTGR